MSDSGLLSVGEVNELGLEEFLWLFGNVVEKTPEAASYVFSRKPFKNANHIVLLFSKYMDTLPEEEQEDLLRKFPDLRDTMKITDEEVEEQVITDDTEDITDYYYRYREKFGFPYVVCTREYTMDAMFDNIQERLENENQVELKKGLEEIKCTVKHRLFELVWHD